MNFSGQIAKFLEANSDRSVNGDGLHKNFGNRRHTFDNISSDIARKRNTDRQPRFSRSRRCA